MRNTISLLMIFSFFMSCHDKAEKKIEKQETVESTVLKSESQKNKTSKTDLKKDVKDFIPQGFVIYKDEGFGDVKGDLNNDGLEDLVIMIKATDKKKIVTDEVRGKLDRNRRGIIILFNKGDHYELGVKNYTCFSSENEEGGAYYAPELILEINKGKLFINYLHGRYGNWKYTFRYKNGDFDLIGYDNNSNNGPVTQFITSINFITKKKLIRNNLNKDDSGDDYEENFVDTWEKLNIPKLTKLSEVDDFDSLDDSFIF